MPRHATKTSFANGHIPWNKGKIQLNLDKEELRRLYYDVKMSILEIAKIKGVTDVTILNIMKMFKLKRRTKSQACSLAHSKGKLKPPPIRSGEKNPHWKGGRFKRKSGYVMVHCPNHHRARARGSSYVQEHILVWEKANGKRVPRGHVIHHINGIRDDNRPENLVALPVKKHGGNTLLRIAQRKIRKLEQLLKQKGVIVDSRSII